MNWTNFFIILLGVPAGMAVLLGWVKVGMTLEDKIGENAALAFMLGTVILVMATVIGLVK